MTRMHIMTGSQLVYSI